MKFVKYFFAVLIIAAINPANASLRVITSTEDLASIARSIGGDKIDVESLTPGTRDPHFAEAKPSMIRKVAKADLLIVIGADLEIGWLPPLMQSSRNSDVQIGSNGYLDVSQHIQMLGVPTGDINRAMGDVHAKGNPHYWLDPSNGLLIAQAIAGKLSELDAKHSSDYENNLATFENRLKDKLVLWKSALAPMEHKPIITYHTSMLYLANAFNLKIVDNIEPKPGIAPSASHINQLIKTIKDEQVGIIIMEPYYEQRSANMLNSKTGIKVAVIPQSVGATTGATDYISLFDEIVRLIKQN